MKIISVLISVFFVSNLYAQEESIQKIKERYAAVNSKNAGYQTHTLELNTMQAAIGLQTTKINFRYLAFQPDPEDEPSKWEYSLAKTTVTYNISDEMKYRTEYLFDKNQQLVFYSKKAIGKWENYEYRYYFDNQKLLKVIISGINEMGLKINYTNTKNFKEKDLNYANKCLLNAEKYLSFFELLPEIEYLDK